MDRLAELEGLISPLGSALIAFSGGPASTLVAAVAARTLGERALAVTAVSAALVTGEGAAAGEVAGAIGIAHETVETHELTEAGYRENGPDRCYHCRGELYGRLRALARARGLAVVLSGAVSGGSCGSPPALRATGEQQVCAPLLELGLGGLEARGLVRLLGLPYVESEGPPCLVSRLPEGVPAEPETLRRIDRAEQALRLLGYQTVRVRHHGELGRVELCADELPRAVDGAADVTAALRSAGYAKAEIDGTPLPPEWPLPTPRKLPGG